MPVFEKLLRWFGRKQPPAASTIGPSPPMERPPRHRSAVKRFFLFSAGASCEVLDECPHSEERLLAGLGSLVMVTSFLAFVSMYVMAGMAFHVGVYLKVLLATGWAGAVYVIDRFLVSVPLNPHRFGNDEPSLPTRALTFVKTLLGAVPRILLALAGGLIIAEGLLLVAFESEINDRVTEEQDTLSQRLTLRAHALYDPQIEDLKKDATADQRAVASARQDRDQILSHQLPLVQGRITQLKLVHDAECSGQRVTWTDPQTGVTYRTTDQPRCGEHAKQLLLALQDAQNDEASLRQRLAQDNATLVRLAAAVAEIRARDARRAQLEGRLRGALDSASKQASASKGLLIRVDALESLAADREPFLPSPNSGGGRSGIPAQPSVATVVFGLTTLGLVVWLTRLFIVLIDTMAIFGKLFLSLRRRRPYDAVTAEHEHTAIATATHRFLDAEDAVRAKREAIAERGFTRRSRLRDFEKAEAAGATDLRPKVHVKWPDGTEREYTADEVFEVPNGASGHAGPPPGTGRSR